MLITFWLVRALVMSKLMNSVVSVLIPMFLVTFVSHTLSYIVYQLYDVYFDCKIFSSIHPFSLT